MKNTSRPFRLQLETMCRILCSSVALLLLIPFAARGEGSDVKFRHITIDEGLSQNFVYTILHDSKGYMWFGTRDGLNKYDGYTFTYHKNQPFSRHSIPTNVVRALKEDRTGGIWITGLHAGLVRYDRTTGTFVHWTHDPRDSESLSDDDIGQLFIDREGYLWIGMANTGVYRLTIRTDSIAALVSTGTKPRLRFERIATPMRGRRSDSLFGSTAMGQDRDGNIWTVGQLGLFRIDRKGGGIKHQSRIPGLAHITWGIPSFVIDRDARLLLATTRGLCIYDARAASSKMITSTSVTKVAQDSSGIIWTSGDDGVHTYDPASGALQHYQFGRMGENVVVGSHVLSLVADRTGRMWIGTDGGVNRVDRTALRFDRGGAGRDYSALERYNIRSIAEDSSGLLWLGTAGSGVLCFDRKEGKIVKVLIHPRGENQNFINTICIDRSGKFWFGHRGGVATIVGGELRDLPLPPSIPDLVAANIWAIHEDRHGLLWIGGNSGVFTYDRATRSTTLYRHDPRDPKSISFNGAWKVMEDRSGELWLATPGGINRFDRASGTFVSYVHDSSNFSSLGSNQVWGLYEDRKGWLWVGTWGGGLNRFDRGSGRFTHYMETNGLASNTIHGILEDDTGSIWVSTGAGISKLDPLTGSLSNFGVADGLPANEFNPNACCRTRDGEFLFGGIYGLSHFYPASVGPLSSFVPPVVITAFRQLDSLRATEMFDGTELEIAYNENYCSFEFAALDFENPGRIRYAYMLEGLDRDWIYSGGRRYVTYTNLEPGDYIFRVKATNSDGVWNEKGIAIHLRVIPPFWRTWQFQTLAVAMLALVALGWAVRRARRRRQLELALDEAREIERREIAAELHDGPLQDLYSVRFILEPLFGATHNGTDSTALMQIDDTLKRVRGSLRNVCGDLQLPSFDCGIDVAIGAYVERLMESLPDLDVRLELMQEVSLSQDVRRNLFRAFRSAITNVVKHAQATRVTVRLREEGRSVALEVEDNGRGFLPPQSLTELMRKKHYGLLLIDAHARAVGGAMEVRSKPGGGALIRVTVEPQKIGRNTLGARLAGLFGSEHRIVNR